MGQKANILFINATIDKLKMLEEATQGRPVHVIHVLSWDAALSRVRDTQVALIVIDSQLCSDFADTALQAFIREAEGPIILMPDDHTFAGVQQMVRQFDQPIDVMIPSFGPGMLNNKIECFLRFHDREKEVVEVTQKLQGFVADTDLLTQKVMELDAAKTEFLTGISRTVHSAMNGVIGMLDIVLDETVPDKVKDCLYTARSSANGLVAMMNDIVDISSIETGEIQIERQHCSLSDILLDMDSLIQAQLAEQEGIFDLEMRGPVPAAVYVDPIRLKQCLLDLVHSTTKELNSHVVTLGVNSSETEDDHQITFEIVHQHACDCAGEQGSVCRNYWQRIHTILHQERRTDQHPNGADLGLMIAFKLSRLLGGHLSLKSEPHEPIRLSLTLPAGMAGKPVDMISELHRHKLPLPVPEPVQSRHFFGRVLVADDDKVDRQVISAMLKKFGVNIVTVNRGKDVLEQAQKGVYDLLIVDMLMPDMDGCEVTRRLRADGMDTPIVALTGNVMKPEIDACLEAGYTEHLPKPIDQTQLADVLSRYLPVRQTQPDSADIDQAVEPVGV